MRSSTLQKLNECTQLNPWVTLVRLVLDWLIIICTIIYSELLNHPIVYLLAVLIIGARMHALGVLMHDIVHYRFFKKRSLSDLMGNMIVCWPLFFTLEAYRDQHLRHHSQLNSDQDPDLYRRKDHPDWQFPMTRWQLMVIMVKDALGLNLFQYGQKIVTIRKNNKKLKLDSKKVDLVYLIKMLSYQTIVFGLVIYSFGFKVVLLYWIVPIATSLKLIKRFRAIAEHFAIPTGKYAELTRTTLANSLETFFIGAHGINYHVEHHRFPAIPWYNLESFHRHVMKTGELKTWGHISYGYTTGVFNEALSQCSLNLQLAPNR